MYKSILQCFSTGLWYKTTKHMQFLFLLLPEEIEILTGIF